MKRDPYSTYLDDNEDGSTDLLSVLDLYELDILEDLSEHDTFEHSDDIAEVFCDQTGHESAWQCIELLREEKVLRMDLSDGFY